MNEKIVKYKEGLTLLSNKTLSDRLSSETIKIKIEELNTIREEIFKNSLKLPKVMEHEVYFDNAFSKTKTDDFYKLSTLFKKSLSTFEEIQNFTDMNDLMIMPFEYTIKEIQNSNLSQYQKLADKINFNLFIVTSPIKYDITAHLMNSNSFNFKDIYIGNKELKTIISSAFLTLPILKAHTEHIKHLYKISKELDNKIDNLRNEIYDTFTPVIKNFTDILIDHDALLHKDTIKSLIKQYDNAKDYIKKEYTHSTYETNTYYPGDDPVTTEIAHYKDVFVPKEIEQKEINEKIKNIEKAIKDRKINLSVLLKIVENNTKITKDKVIDVDKTLEIKLENISNHLQYLVSSQKTMFIMTDNKTLSESTKFYFFENNL